MPTLTYTADGETRTVEVGDSLSIGRMEPCDIVIADEAAASRRHCQIMRLQGSYELTDLGSTNGTKVNGKPVKRHRLESGDRISIGDTSFKWSDGDEDGLELELEEEVSLEDPGGGGSKPKSDAKCYLVFAGGSRDGERVALDTDRVTFGRKASNTVQLSDSAVSGYHCEISQEGGAYILRDLGSTNGTLLDGEPVGENVLQHGGRIKIGAERLVFVNPAVSEFESAMASVDDLGSEWGMLRAEMDMERINRARRSQMIAIVGVLAVVGVGGYLVLGTDLLKPERASLATLEGNLVSDFSFEDGSLRPTRVAGTPARANVETDGSAAHQGAAGLVVRREGPAGALALASANESRTVSPGQAYSFGARVRAKNDGFGVVRIRWISQADDEAVQVSATDLVSSGDWTEVRGVAVPPARTTAAALEYGNAGTGAVDFDDVFFGPATGGSGQVTLDSGDVKVVADADGSVTVTRGSDVLLQDVMVVTRVMERAGEAGASLGPRVGAAVIDSVAEQDGGVVVTGQALDTLGLELHPFTMTWTPGDGGEIALTATLPAGAAVLGVVPDEFIDGGNGVFRSDGTSVRLSGARTVQGVTEAFLGERRPFQVEAAAEDGDFQLALLQRDGGYELGLADEGELSVRIRTDNRALIAERGASVDELREALARKRYGEAIAKAGEVATKFATGHAEQVGATETLERLDREGNERLGALERRIDAAEKFDDANDLAGAVAEAQEFAASYEGHAFAARAEALAEKARAALAARRSDIAQRAAQPLLARAADHAGSGNVQLARAFYEEVVARYAGTEAATQAQTALAGLEGRD